MEVHVMCSLCSRVLSLGATVSLMNLIEMMANNYLTQLPRKEIDVQALF